MDIQRKDCVKMMSVIWNQEEIRAKKRRWIVGDPTLSVDSEKTSKKTKFLPESLLRNSQVIETFLGRRLGGNFQVVQDYVHLFDPQMIENHAIFRKDVSFLLTSLKSQALNRVLDVVGEINVELERNKSPENGIEEIVAEIFTSLKSDTYNNIATKLAAVFRDPMNYRNQKKLTTIVNAQLISTIRKTMELIDIMPKQTLLAMKRKFDCVQLVPQIPVCTSGKQEFLVHHLKKACDKALYVLKEGDELPEPFAKALSVILLSIKLSLKKPCFQTSEFFPFSPEIVALQEEILKAIWTIPKVKAAELKMLRCILDPTSKLTLRNFRTGVIKYLTEFLFECGDIDIPKLLTEVLSFINRKSKRCLDHIRLVSNKDEIDLVMNISAQLKEIIWNNFPADYVEQLLSDSDDLVDEYDSDDGGDIIIDEKGYSYLGECSALGVPGSFTDAATEGVGDSEPADLFVEPARVATKPLPALENLKAPESQQDTIFTGCSLSARKTGCNLKGGLNSPASLRIETVCDETAVFAYKIIDQVLEGLLGNGNHENNTTKKHTKEDTKKIDILGSRGPALLAETVEKLAPNFPKSGLEKMKKLTGLS